MEKNIHCYNLFYDFAYILLFTPIGLLAKIHQKFYNLSMDMEEKQIHQNKVNGKKLAIIITASVLSIAIILGIAFISTVWCVYGSAFFSSVGQKQAKAEKYAKENLDCEINQIVFYGDSITEMYDLENAFPGLLIYNRAISGDRVPHMVERLESNVFELKPKTLVFLGGANDLRDGVDPEVIANNIFQIIDKSRKNYPNTKIIVQSVYPCNYTKSFCGKNLCKNMTIEATMELNRYIKEICERENVIYLDVFSHLADENNQLKADLSIDGIHINDKAYEIVTNLLKQYIE